MSTKKKQNEVRLNPEGKVDMVDMVDKVEKKMPKADAGGANCNPPIMQPAPGLTISPYSPPQV